MSTGSPSPLTGERTVPGIASENYWFRRHEAAYQHLAGVLLGEHLPGARLLEVGAGEGYGASRLAGAARLTCALDYDRTAVTQAARYRKVYPVQANLAALPIATGSVDVLVSLQVIEHVWDHRQFLDECRRVLRPGGPLVLSTPNRLTFSPGAGSHDRPVNPFHSHEFTATELRALLHGSEVGELALTGLHAGPRLRQLDADHARSGGLVAAQLATPPELWDARLLADVRSVTAADFDLSPADLDASLDLIVLTRWA